MALESFLMALVDASGIATFKKRTMKVFCNVKGVDDDDHPVLVECWATWSLCRLQHSQGLFVERGVGSSVRLYQRRRK